MPVSVTENCLIVLLSYIKPSYDNIIIGHLFLTIYSAFELVDPSYLYIEREASVLMNIENNSLS